jgi:hypothetical protein
MSRHWFTQEVRYGRFRLPMDMTAGAALRADLLRHFTVGYVPLSNHQFVFFSRDVLVNVALCCLPLESRIYILSPFTAN